jgi:drug/metabolite transporter (DMT)-like permease
MYWQYSLGMLIVINTLSIILTKFASDKLLKKSVGIFYQFLFCLGMATGYAFLMKELDVNLSMLLVVIVGFINAFANYLFLRALEISLSKTALFFPLIEMISISLAVIFLGETIIWTPQIFIGIVLCFLAIFLFQIPKNSKKAKAINSKKWLIFVLTMIAIYGVDSFFVKAFSSNIARGTFLVGWYSGSLLGSLPLLFLEKQRQLLIAKKMILFLLFLSITVFGTLFLSYLTFQLGGPLSIVQPLRRFFTVIMPIFFGWLVFKERERLSKQEEFGFFAGITGVFLVLLV